MDLGNTPVGSPPTFAEKTQILKSIGGVSNNIGFYDDFSLKADGTTITKGVTMPMIGAMPWLISYDDNLPGTHPSFINGGFGRTTDSLWYIGSSVPIYNGKFSFGCEMHSVGTAMGLNMTFSHTDIMPPGPGSPGIYPRSTVHTNFVFGGVTQGGGVYKYDVPSVNAATGVIQITNHFAVTGSPILFPDVGTSGLNGTTTYYAIVIDANNLKVASTYNNAMAGTAMSIAATANYSMSFMVNDWVCLNRVYDGANNGYPFHPYDGNINGASAPNVRSRVLFDVDGEFMTITLDKVGCVMFQSPSLGRRMAYATNIYFWYEGAAGQQIRRAWANAPMIDATISSHFDSTYYNSAGNNAQLRDKLGTPGALHLGPFKIGNDYMPGNPRLTVGGVNPSAVGDGTLRFNTESAIFANGLMIPIGGENGATYGKPPASINSRKTYPIQTATINADTEIFQLGRFPFLFNGEYITHKIRATIAAGGTKSIKMVQYITGETPFNIDLSAYSGQLEIDITRCTTNVYTDDVYVTAYIGTTLLLKNARLPYNLNQWWPWLVQVNQTVANAISVNFIETMCHLNRTVD